MLKGCMRRVVLVIHAQPCDAPTGRCDDRYGIAPSPPALIKLIERVL